MTLPKNSVWFITGCSTGIGRELAKHVLGCGYRAVVTARNPLHIQDIIEDYEGRAIALKLDVTDPVQVDEALKKANDAFDNIDVLVNNAGIGYFAAIEESEEDKVRTMFEINFFGLARVTQAVLPGMRECRSGYIVNISSLGGLIAAPANGYYCATKFAIEGFSEALSKEVDLLGIKVICVEPGGFRTDWAGRSAAKSESEISDYAETAGKLRRAIRNISGRQAGDPARAAMAIIKAIEAPNPPQHLLLGKVTLSSARNKLELLRRDFDAWEETTISADFPEGE